MSIFYDIKNIKKWSLFREIFYSFYASLVWWFAYTYTLIIPTSHKLFLIINVILTIVFIFKRERKWLFTAITIYLLFLLFVFIAPANRCSATTKNSEYAYNCKCIGISKIDFSRLGTACIGKRIDCYKSVINPEKNNIPGHYYNDKVEVACDSL